MPSFEYSVRDTQGNASTGLIEAESQPAAARQLVSQGWFVTSLRETRRAATVHATATAGAVTQATAVSAAAASGPSAASRAIAPVYTGVSVKDLALFYRQFATLVKAGLTLHQSLTTLQQQTTSAPLRAIIGEMALSVGSGQPISPVMKRYPRVFTELQIRLVEAGEAGGLLHVLLARLADYLEQEWEVRQEIKRRTLYPKILLAAVLFIPNIPILIFQGFVAYLQACLSLAVPIALVCLAVYVVMRYALTNPAFARGYDDAKLLIPVIGPLVRKLALGKMLRALSCLFDAGVPIGSALETAAGTAGNRAMAARLGKVIPMVQQGVPLTEALRATGDLPPMALSMVATGEQAGGMGDMLAKTSDYYDAEARHSITQLTVILGVVLLLIMAVIIGMKVIGFYSGYGSQVTSTGAQ
jgi:type IV pilus assembly protein PilC